MGTFPRVTHPSATVPEGTVRLACVKPAASVRSEPGSNSHVEEIDPKASLLSEIDEGHMIGPLLAEKTVVTFRKSREHKASHLTTRDQTRSRQARSGSARTKGRPRFSFFLLDNVKERVPRTGKTRAGLAEASPGAQRFPEEAKPPRRRSARRRWRLSIPRRLRCQHAVTHFSSFFATGSDRAESPARRTRPRLNDVTLRGQVERLSRRRARPRKIASSPRSRLSSPARDVRRVAPSRGAPRQRDHDGA
jgi:hypothetical protein